MSDTFDINDRSTWDWVYSGPAEFPAEIGDYRLDPTSPHHFYQMSKGVATRMPCGAETVFNPTANPGPVCDNQSNVSEEDIYNWAVSKGLVNDQR